MWEGAPEAAAAEQRPLLDPEREGERVVHHLETLPPLQAWDDLLAVAFSTAARMLAVADGASLPPAAAQLSR